MYSLVLAYVCRHKNEQFEQVIGMLATFYQYGMLRIVDKLV